MSLFDRSLYNYSGIYKNRQDLKILAAINSPKEFPWGLGDWRHEGFSQCCSRILAEHH